MKKLFQRLLPIGAIFSVFIPGATSAHEVYILSRAQIAHDVIVKSPNPFIAIFTSTGQFVFWGVIIAVLILTVFLISISRRIEKKLDPFLFKMKRWAPLVARITLGVGLCFSAYYAAWFGPELPFTIIFGSYYHIFQVIVLIIGLSLLLGLYTRWSAFLAALLYIWSMYVIGPVYMLTYLNYFGEMVFMLLMGGGVLAMDRLRFLQHQVTGVMSARLVRTLHELEHFSFMVLRICFGVAIIFASLYAKVIHSELALDTINQYHLTNYFHFTPLFLVMGAAIVELLIGLFITFGFQVRFAALVFTGFLCVSIAFFGEAVWPHIVLFGVNIVLIMHGYDKYSLEGMVFKKRGREPVL